MSHLSSYVKSKKKKRDGLQGEMDHKEKGRMQLWLETNDAANRKLIEKTQENEDLLLWEDQQNETLLAKLTVLVNVLQRNRSTAVYL